MRRVANSISNQSVATGRPQIDRPEFATRCILSASAASALKIWTVDKDDVQRSTLAKSGSIC